MRVGMNSPPCCLGSELPRNMIKHIFNEKHFPFYFWLALPWGMLAHSQYQNLVVIQIASLTGAYGVSFLVMAVNSVIALGIIKFGKRIQRSPETEPGQPSKRNTIAMASATAALSIG